MASWISVLLTATLMVVVCADWHKRHYYKPKTVKCYQCAYSPGKTVYKEEKFPVRVAKYDKYHKKVYKTVYKTRQVPVSKPGGWDKCLGPFDHYQAKDYGVDVWVCHDNCYTRVDGYGNIFRGCYKDEWRVDSSKLGCHYQAGSLYCFCKGDKCNNQAVPSHAKKSSYEEPKHDSYSDQGKNDGYY